MMWGCQIGWNVVVCRSNLLWLSSRVTLVETLWEPHKGTVFAITVFSHWVVFMSGVHGATAYVQMQHIKQSQWVSELLTMIMTAEMIMLMLDRISWRQITEQQDSGGWSRNTLDCRSVVWTRAVDSRRWRLNHGAKLRLTAVLLLISRTLSDRWRRSNTSEELKLLFCGTPHLPNPPKLCHQQPLATTEVFIPIHPNFSASFSCPRRKPLIHTDPGPVIRWPFLPLAPICCLSSLRWASRGYSRMATVTECNWVSVGPYLSAR